VLVYYAITNAAALTLGTGRAVPVAGLAGCLVVAASLPLASLTAGTAVLAMGALLWAATRRVRWTA
jgi:APA family basic amino acid/polyamine antiporter